MRTHLVTGAGGFSGSYVVRELLRAGERVIATDRAGSWQQRLEHAAAIGLDSDHPNLTFVEADLLEPESLKPLFEHPITHVFHTASLYDYSAPLERLRKINVEGSQNLLNLALDANLTRFIHWSTCGVFGKPYSVADSRKKVNIPFEEDTNPSPKSEAFGVQAPTGTHLVNAYSVSKWEQEQMMWKAHREQGLPLTVVRPAPIYGPGSSYGHGGIIIGMAQGMVPVIPSDSRNFITISVHAWDVARFVCFIAERDDAIGEDYNIIDDSIISYHEFLHYIALLTGQRLRDIPWVKMRSLRPGMIAAAKLWTTLNERFGVPRVRIFEVQSTTYVSSSYWASNRKSKATGFEYRYADVHEGLKDTIAWFRKQGWLTSRSRLFV